MNPTKTATGAAAKGLVKIVRDELARAQAPLPGLSRPAMNALCRCANTRCVRQVGGNRPLLFSRPSRRCHIHSVEALLHARDNYRQKMGSNPEPCRLLCDGCAADPAAPVCEGSAISTVSM